MKMERAAHHIQDFTDLCTALFKSDAYRTVVERDANGAERTKQILGPAELRNSQIFLDLCCTAGDAIHNLRSALDHLAYAVARNKGMSPRRSKDVSFPIRGKSEEFERALKEGKIEKINEDWLAFVRSHQPYTRPSGLHRISKLDNLDKHCEIIAFSLTARTAVLRPGESVPEVANVRFDEGVLVKTSEPYSYLISAFSIQFADAEANGLAIQASMDLLMLQHDVYHVIRDAKARFFS